MYRKLKSSRDKNEETDSRSSSLKDMMADGDFNLLLYITADGTGYGVSILRRASEILDKRSDGQTLSEGGQGTVKKIVEKSA